MGVDTYCELAILSTQSLPQWYGMKSHYIQGDYPLELFLCKSCTGKCCQQAQVCVCQIRTPSTHFDSLAENINSDWLRYKTGSKSHSVYHIHTWSLVISLIDFNISQYSI